MRKPSIDLEFECKLKNCSGLSDIPNLVLESPKKNLKFLDESCKPCTQLIKYQFSRLQLKGVPFRVPEEASDRDIDELFKSLTLEKLITANTMLTVKSAESLKPSLVYAARTISASEKKNYFVMGSALFTCGALLTEFKSIDLNTKEAECLDKLFVFANLSCIKPIEALYYTLNYSEPCPRCGSKRSPQKTVNAYPISKPCKKVKKKLPVLKRKRKNVAAEKDD